MPFYFGHGTKILLVTEIGNIFDLSATIAYIAPRVRPCRIAAAPRAKRIGRSDRGVQPIGTRVRRLGWDAPSGRTLVVCATNAALGKGPTEGAILSAPACPDARMLAAESRTRRLCPSDERNKLSLRSCARCRKSLVAVRAPGAQRGCSQHNEVDRRDNNDDIALPLLPRQRHHRGQPRAIAAAQSRRQVR
jgi:hypothetical protein